MAETNRKMRRAPLIFAARVLIATEDRLARRIRTLARKSPWKSDDELISMAERLEGRQPQAPASAAKAAQAASQNAPDLHQSPCPERAGGGAYNKGHARMIHRAVLINAARLLVATEEQPAQWVQAVARKTPMQPDEDGDPNTA